MKLVRQMMFVFCRVSWCKVLLFDVLSVGLMCRWLLCGLCRGQRLSDFGCVKLSRVCFCRFFRLCGCLCVFRQVGFVSICSCCVLSRCVCRVELCSVLMWIVMLVFFFSRLMIRLLVFSFSLICGYCVWKFGISGVIICSMKGMVVLMCRWLVGCWWCRVICFLVLLMVVRILCVCVRNVVFLLVSDSCCVVCESRVVFSFFFRWCSVWFIFDIVWLSCFVVVVMELVLIIVWKVSSFLSVVFIVDC